MIDVFYDDETFTVPYAFGGVSNYFVQLVRTFREQRELEVRPIGFPKVSLNRHLDEIDARVPPLRGVRPRRRIVQAENVAYRRLFGRRRPAPQVLHHTWYFAPALRRGPWANVITVHDMMPEVFPHLVSGNPHANKAAHIRQADGIVCVSEATRDDLLRLFPDVRAPVVVSPLGVRPSAAGEAQRSERTVLYIGARNELKGFDTFAAALGMLPVELAVDLHLVGGTEPSAEETAELQALAGVRSLRWSRPSDRELADLYRAARCVAVPSKYEGFGLPVIEALGAGTQVLCSDIPVFREVAGDAARFVAEGQPEAWRDALLDVLRSPWGVDDERGGRARGEAFTWSRTAAATRECYDRAQHHRASR